MCLLFCSCPLSLSWTLLVHEVSHPHYYPQSLFLTLFFTTLHPFPSSHTQHEASEITSSPLSKTISKSRCPPHAQIPGVDYSLVPTCLPLPYWFPPFWVVPLWDLSSTRHMLLNRGSRFCSIRLSWGHHEQAHHHRWVYHFELLSCWVWDPGFCAW